MTARMHAAARTFRYTAKAYRYIQNDKQFDNALQNSVMALSYACQFSSSNSRFSGVMLRGHSGNGAGGVGILISISEISLPRASG